MVFFPSIIILQTHIAHIPRKKLRKSSQCKNFHFTIGEKTIKNISICVKSAKNTKKMDINLTKNSEHNQ